MTQLKKMQDLRQERVENQLALLARIRVLIELDGLRVSQAIARTGETALLAPVLEDFANAIRSVRSIQATLRIDWDQGQRDQWEEEP